MIYKDMQEKLKEAMVQKNSNVKNYIRNIKSRLSEFQVANGLDRTKNPSDEEMISVISSQVKSLEKAISQFEKGGQIEGGLIDEYKLEIVYLKRFLPDESELSTNIESLVDEAIEQCGKNVGQVMGYIMKNHKGLDGKLVKTIVLKRIENE